MKAKPRLTGPLALLFFALAGLPIQEAWAAKRVLLLIGESEYKTAETLPRFAEEVLKPAGFSIQTILASETDPNSFPGLEQALKETDVLWLSVRRRTPPQPQLDAIRAYLKSGRGLVAIRTSSHAFALRTGTPPEGHDQWPNFDNEILGGDYQNHFRNQDGTPVSALPHAVNDPLLQGIRETSFHSAGTLYRSRDLASDCVTLLRGTAVENSTPQLEPVAWYRKKSKVFYTSLGHPGDFELKPFQHLMLNATFWAAGLAIPADAEASKERDRLNLEAAGNAEVEKVMKSFSGKGEVGDTSLPTPPDQVVQKFQVHEDFEISVVAAEPVVEQPLFMTWDQRARLWVVQYRQYPFPAGLKVIRYDQYLRAVFDKVPEPPPHGTPGKDRITIHEDTDGDGIYDHHKVLLDGLNITSAVAPGRDGFWVLNPPYLLFYRDADHNDVPDGDPEVHLSGFGLEDTHSVANSLRWGPDGWLYGVNGSTTTGNVRSRATPETRFKGQCVWRYQPDTGVFEVYAEGGGNTFSLDFDLEGRVFSGSNNGRTRGMHYVQGGYARKNWGKHGPLTNPYAFGFYEHMRHQGFEERFSQAFTIYEGPSFPKQYRHAVIAANSLHNRVVASQLFPDTSTWRTEDLHPLILSTDRWFRPVDVKVGPDGAVYLADWYDSRLTHVDPRDNWHKSSGRIYRLQAKQAGKAPLPSVAGLEEAALIAPLIDLSNAWLSEAALREIAWRKATSLVPQLRRLVLEDQHPGRVQALWALHQLGQLDESSYAAGLASDSAVMRRCTLRILGDGPAPSSSIGQSLIRLSGQETEAEVRSQMAATAKRLPASIALPMIRQLAAQDSDLEDLHIPLLVWWALEAQAGKAPTETLAWLKDRSFWSLPMTREHLIERLMRRFALAGSPADLEICARLFDLAPDETARKSLLTGFEAAFMGRNIPDLPPSLEGALKKQRDQMGASGLLIGVRQGESKAIQNAAKAITSSSTPLAERLQLIRALGEIHPAQALSPLKALLRVSDQTALNLAALQALASFDDPSIGKAIVASYHSTLLDQHGVRSTAQRVLASRKPWALDLLNEVNEWRIPATDLPLDVVRLLAGHDDPVIQDSVKRHWGRIGTTQEDKTAEVARVDRLISSGGGEWAPGRELFRQLCATCHTLFGEGGQVGPELTGYERDNRDFLLTAIVDPNAAIREEFTTFSLETRDGRLLTGLLENQDERTVSLKTLDGQTHVLPRGELARFGAEKLSLMPEGLTAALTDQQVRDLFAYISRRTPPGE